MPDVGPVIHPIPDENTSEAILYGDQYLFAKSSRFFWDSVEDMMEAEAERLMHTIRNPEFAVFVMKYRSGMIFSSQPPINDPSQIRDLWTLRQIVAYRTGMELLNVSRLENTMWSMMHGIRGYTSRLLDTGVSQQEWKAATLGMDMPIEYDTVRSVVDRDDLRAAKDVADVIDREARRKAEAERFQYDYEQYLEGKPPEPDSPADRLVILRERTESKRTYERRNGTEFGRRLGAIVSSWTEDPLDWMVTLGRAREVRA